MTRSDITEALSEVRDSVDVPSIDQVAFQRLVVRERRRRTTGRVLVAGAAATVLAAGVGLAAQLDTRNDATPVAPPEDPVALLAPMQEPIPYLRDNMLQIRRPDHSTVDTGERVEEVLGLTERGVAAVDDDSRLLLFPLHNSGGIGPGAAVTDEPVQRAWLSKDRTRMGWVTRDNALHLRELGADHDYWTGQLLSQQTQLVALDGTHWIEDEGDRLSLRYPDESFEVLTSIDPESAELAGATLAVQSVEGVEFFSAADGSPIVPGGIGGGEGALSPTGSTYAAGYDQGSVESGASAVVEVIDTSDGSAEAITGVDYDGVLDVSWTGTNFLVLITRNGKNSVLECSADALACTELIQPTTDPLQLPSS